MLHDHSDDYLHWDYDLSMSTTTGTTTNTMITTARTTTTSTTLSKGTTTTPMTTSTRTTTTATALSTNSLAKHKNNTELFYNHRYYDYKDDYDHWEYEHETTGNTNTKPSSFTEASSNSRINFARCHGQFLSKRICIANLEVNFACGASVVTTDKYTCW